mmetsp:Transcript_3111/g.19173  ORF Transcript_3111/g.19173 Transcript_3111/m.19173 type:complete len:128 (-) Transcript_3111:93-476(-)
MGTLRRRAAQLGLQIQGSIQPNETKGATWLRNQPNPTQGRPNPTRSTKTTAAATRCRKERWTRRSMQGDACAKLELSQKIFNFTEDQDLKIKVGLDVLRRNVYAQIRENNWTLSTDMRGSWHVSYDL